MILRTLLALAIFTTSAHAADFNRSLPVSGQADVYVTTPSGRVQIIPSNGSSVEVRAHIYAEHNLFGDSNSDIDQRMRQISEHPPIQQTGNVIHIGNQPEDRRLYDHITIDYQISVPRTAALNLRTGSGDIEVDNVGRYLKADTGSGSVRAHQLSGPADLHTGSGDIELQEQAAADIKANTGSGSVRITGIAGALDASSGSGDIEIGGRLTGASRMKSGSGSIRLHLDHAPGIDLEASTGSGAIRVPGTGSSDAHHLSTSINGGGPHVQLNTGSGDIEVN